MSNETFDPNSKKRPHPHHKLPSKPKAKGRVSALKAPMLVKHSEIALSIVYYSHLNTVGFT